MHSSRMRTGRALTVSGGGGCLPGGGVSAWRGGVPGGGVPDQAPPPKIWRNPPPCGQTHACENITLAKTSFRPVIKQIKYLLCINLVKHEV